MQSPRSVGAETKFSWSIEVLESFETSGNSGGDKGCFPSNIGRTYNFERVDQRFMSNNTRNVAIEELIDTLGHRQRSLEHLGDIYMQLC